MKQGPDSSQEKKPPPLMREALSLYAYAESNPSAILITDIKGEIQYVNTAWQRLTGYSRDEVMGKNPRFLNSGKTPPGLYKQLWAALREGRSFESDDFVDKRKDGSEFSLHAMFFPAQLRKNTTYFVQVVQDISNKKEIDKLKDLFLSFASHELRNPLSTMVISLDLLKHEMGSEPNAAEKTLATLSSAMNRFKSLFAYMLDVNKIHSDALNIHRERKNLGHLIERIAAEMQVIFPSHTLTVEIKSPHPFAAFDEERIAQVLVNLISNAIKYSPQADQVIIRLSEAAGSLKVSVQDFGIGIPEEARVKIFEMLYRAKNKGVLKGTGLGLYISAHILAAHDALLSVESEEGKGSTFHFSLPLIQ